MKKKLNYKILIPILLFSIISVVSIGFITKSSTQYSEGWISFPIKQSIGFVIGFVIIFVLGKINLLKTNKLVNIAYYVLLVMLIILVADIPGVSSFFTKKINGARGWFQFFPGGPVIQPVEFMKIAMIMKLALISSEHLSNHDEDKVLFQKYALFGLIPMVLVLIQPDLGGAILLAVPWLIMLLLSVKNKAILRTLILALLCGIGLFVVFLIIPQGQDILLKVTPIQPYQLDRLNSWLYPFDYDKGLQLQQSLILMGSAGLTGHGITYSAISFPEPHTDMIFAKIVGMFGYIMGFLVIGIYYVIINEILTISQNVTNYYFKFIAIGVAGLFIIQVTENIGMIVGLLPITGIVLPFLSYGVSALITYALIIGIILNIDQHQEEEL